MDALASEAKPSSDLFHRGASRTQLARLGAPLTPRLDAKTRITMQPEVRYAITNRMDAAIEMGSDLCHGHPGPPQGSKVTIVGGGVVIAALAWFAGKLSGVKTRVHGGYNLG